TCSISRPRVATKKTCPTRWSGCATTTGTSRRRRAVRAAREQVMTSIWPWLVVAGIGALHGLNPATGWMFSAAWGVQSRDRAQAVRALLPIAAGHATSVALVAAAVALGMAMDRIVLQALAGGLLVVVAVVHLSRRAGAPARAGHAALGLWSFMMSTAHGAG